MKTITYLLLVLCLSMLACASSGTDSATQETRTATFTATVNCVLNTATTGNCKVN